MAEKNISPFLGGDVRDMIRELVRDSLSELMELEVRALTGAGLGERSEDRKTSRNGYRDRLYKSRVGDLELRIPKLRQGSYFPGFLEPRRTVEKALVGVIQEAYLQGVSTRSVDDLVQALGCSGISKSEVSRLCLEVEGRVREFLERPLEGGFPYVWLDATYLRVREGSRILSKAVIIALTGRIASYRFRELGSHREIAPESVPTRRGAEYSETRTAPPKVTWSELSVLGQVRPICSRLSTYRLW